MSDPAATFRSFAVGTLPLRHELRANTIHSKAYHKLRGRISFNARSTSDRDDCRQQHSFESIFHTDILLRRDLTTLTSSQHDECALLRVFPPGDLHGVFLVQG